MAICYVAYAIYANAYVTTMQQRTIPASMPNKSTTGELRSTTLNANSTQGRYGAVKLKIPRKLRFTY